MTPEEYAKQRLAQVEKTLEQVLEIVQTWVNAGWREDEGVRCIDHMEDIATIFKEAGYFTE